MKPPFLLGQKRQERISRLLKNDFGVRRLVAAFAFSTKASIEISGKSNVRPKRRRVAALQIIGSSNLNSFSTAC